MSRSRSGDELSPIDRLTMRLEIAEAGIAEIRGRQFSIERQWGEFVPVVSREIGDKIIAPWLRHTIQLPASLDDNRLDPLSLNNFDINAVIDKINQRGKG